VSWLWRKSKENFIINKMIGQLVNELMRGIVVFCFVNKIDLKTGQISKAEEGEKEAEQEGEQEAYEEYKTKQQKDWTIQDYKNASKEWNVEKIKHEIDECTSEISGIEKTISDYKKQIDDANVFLQNQHLPKETKTAKEDSIKKTQQQIEELNKKLEFNKQLKSVFEKELEVKSAVPATETKKKLDTKPIVDACVKKYSFDLNSEPPQVLKDMGVISVSEFDTNFKVIPIDVIKIGESLILPNKNGNVKVKVTNVNKDNNTVSVVNIDDETIKTDVHSEKLRPLNFPDYNKTINSLVKYLSKNGGNYSELSEEKQKNVEIAYMAYSYMKKLNDKKDFDISVNESFDYLNYYILNEDVSEPVVSEQKPETGNVDQTDASIGTSGNLKTKPNDPRAGKSAETGAFKDPKVRDILTKRDKDKYKDNTSEFDVKIKEVNLAEIEKTIESLDSKPGSEKQIVDVSGNTINQTATLEVAKLVNPYNLKVIQLTINQLTTPKTASTTDDGSTVKNSDQSVKVKWQKKLNNTYAAFHRIMDTNYINKIMESTSSSEIDSKTSYRVSKSVNNIKSQENALEMSGSLPVLSKEAVNLTTIGANGYWCYYNFSYKTINYNSVMTPVKNLFPGSPLIQITSIFDRKNGVTTILDKKKDVFKAKTFEGTTEQVKTNNIYFLLKSNQIFPDIKPRIFKVFVLNDVEFQNGDKKLFVLVNTDKLVPGGTGGLLLTNALVRNIQANKSNFLHEINSIYFARFDKSQFPASKTALGVTNVEFTTNPETMTDNAVIENLKELSKLLF
jgi:hypothetical protein